MSEKIPPLRSDEVAEAFFAQHLSNLDFGQFKPMAFEFAKTAAPLNRRLPQPLLDAVKDRARAHGMPCTRYVRQLFERDISAK
jgi:predicted DNA binding CopG/RHH family protein